MKIDRLEEFAIKEKTKVQIGVLLKNCFSDYPTDRIYYKQIPNFRYLVFEKKQLIGHMAVDYRHVNIGGTIASIFGVADLC
ncbi:MAG TPA: GNAT family N-acetyltransferase, partial [Saprospiraceae bacterium]|nr:GNAT family N-acetyltransferase [Saprospiraceae bacterium]